MCKIPATEQNTELKISGRRLGEKGGNESKGEEGRGVEGRGGGEEGKGGGRGGVATWHSSTMSFCPNIC